MKKSIYPILVLIACVVINSCKQNDESGVTELKTQTDSISYYTGIFSAYSIKDLGDSTLNTEIFYQGVKQVLDQNAFPLNKMEVDQNIGTYFDKLRKRQDELNLKKGAEFLKDNKARTGVITTSSGVQYEMISEGAGKKPKISDKVIVNFIGSLIDGSVFVNTYDTGLSDTLIIDKSITMAGLCEVLPLMNTGSKYRVYIPADQSITSTQIGILNPTMVLVMDVELVSVIGNK